MIEGVLFRDGGIEWTKAHEIFEFETDAGVTIEDVVMKDGTMTLSHKRAGVSPVGEIDLLTLVNTGHDRDMDGTMSTVKFRQYYDDSTGNHSAADSSSVVVGTSKCSTLELGGVTISNSIALIHPARTGTENDWSEDPATHNAYMAFYTTHRSLNEERVRITSDGDFMFDTDKVVLRAADGSAELKVRCFSKRTALGPGGVTFCNSIALTTTRLGPASGRRLHRRRLELAAAGRHLHRQHGHRPGGGRRERGRKGRADLAIRRQRAIPLPPRLPPKSTCQPERFI